jgi:hypothetical protein
MATGAATAIKVAPPVETTPMPPVVVAIVVAVVPYKAVLEASAVLPMAKADRIIIFSFLRVFGVGNLWLSYSFLSALISGHFSAEFIGDRACNFVHVHTIVVSADSEGSRFQNLSESIGAWILTESS